MNKNILKKIEQDYRNFTDTNKIIADVLFNYENDKLTLSVRDYAKIAYCAPSSIIKFIKLLGYDSYSIFKYEINKTNTDYSTTLESSFNLVEDFIEDNPIIYNQLISDIKISKKVFIFATGQSRVPALDFTTKANKMDKHKFTFEVEPIYQVKMSNMVDSDSLVIFISNSGKSKELINLYSSIECKNKYLITNRSNTPLSKKFDNIINLNNKLESDYQFKEAPIESKYSLMYLMDKIYIELYNVTN